MSKLELRAGILRVRRDRSADDLEQARSTVAAAVLDRLRGRGCVAGYEPLRTEPGSVALLESLVSAGARVLVPITLPDRDLDWRDWPAGSPLGTDAVGLAETVLVPALAVARNGVRLGRGGGSYDRALLRRSTSTPAVALLFDGELVDELAADPWDVPVDAAVIPSAGWVDLPAGVSSRKL